MFTESLRTHRRVAAQGGIARAIAADELAAVGAAVRLAARAGASPAEIAEAVSRAGMQARGAGVSPAALWLSTSPANDGTQRERVLDPLRGRLLELVRLGPGQRIRELAVRLAAIDERWHLDLVARQLRMLVRGGFLRKRGLAAATAYFSPVVLES